MHDLWKSYTKYQTNVKLFIDYMWIICLPKFFFFDISQYCSHINLNAEGDSSISDEDVKLNVLFFMFYIDAMDKEWGHMHAIVIWNMPLMLYSSAIAGKRH